MKKRFIVLLDQATQQQDTAFIEYLREKGFGWWHWIPNSWLVYSHTELTAAELRDEIKNIYPEATSIVLEGSPGGWAGFGPKSDTKNMFKWIEESWDS